MSSPKTLKRKQILISVAAVSSTVGLLILGMWLNDPNANKPSMIELANKRAKILEKNFSDMSGGLSAEDTWITASERKLTKITETVNKQESQLENVLIAIDSRDKTIEELVTENKKIQNQLAQIIATKDINQSNKAASADKNNSSIPPPPQKTSSFTMPSVVENKYVVTSNTLPPPPKEKRNEVVNSEEQNFVEGEIIHVSMNNSSETKEEGENSKKGSNNNIEHYLPAASFYTAIMLSGLDAPTGGLAKTNPVPVLLRIIDKGQLPNYFNSDVKDCHVYAVGYGEISSERVHLRPEKISCVLSSGKTIEAELKGYVTGEDGKAGLAGNLVEKRGAIIAKSIMAGVFSGAGDDIASQYSTISSSALGTVSTINPSDALKSGAINGVSNASKNVSEYYLERANEMYPIIEVDAKRIINIVLKEGVDLKENIINTKRVSNL